jgi:hypothetical protein
MNGNSKMAPDCFRHSFPPVHILAGAPAFDEVEDVLGALVIASGPSGTRQQSGNPVLLEGLIGDIECLSTDTERLGDMADRPALDPVAAKHLVFDLHAIAGVEEFLLACEGFVAHTLRTRMESAGRVQRRRFGIAWSSRRH